MNIWFTSDTHFGHKNIVSGTTAWTDENQQRLRQFNALEEHDAELVNNFNSVVKEDDILYHLGDWSFGGKDKIWEFREQLICKNIHLILGNHDQHIEKNEQHQTAIFIKRPQELFSSVQHYKELKINGLHFILCHFAMRVWNKSHKGSIMLYGHSHGTLDELKPDITSPTWIGDGYFIKNYKTMDVGVDTNNLYPYHLDQIIDIMRNKDVILNNDHHSIYTN